MQRIVFLFLLISQCAFGQFFVVKDKDGYVNTRVELTAQKYDKKNIPLPKRTKATITNTK